MIIITGAAGFIASCLVSKLNAHSYTNLILVDDFSREEREKNYADKEYIELVDREDFFSWFLQNTNSIDFIFHLGAKTDTTESDKSILDKYNTHFSEKIFHFCCKYKIPLIYASSAATYGGGEFGYSDNHDLIEKLQPLNLYGESKHNFDKWVLKAKQQPPFWAGFKFFNVYGPNEYHKGRMASVILHTYKQIRETDKMKLFSSHKEGVADGMQMRDFVYVKDVVDVLFFFMIKFFIEKQEGINAIYNLGTGKADSFLNLVKSTFKAMEKEENIEFVDTPEDIRDKYQYFTQADISKLRNAGYDKPFAELEEGVSDYVENYIDENRYM